MEFCNHFDFYINYCVSTLCDQRITKVIRSNYLIKVFLLTVLAGCSEQGGLTGPNQAPTMPVVVSPDNSSLQIQNKIALSWEASKDPEGEEVSYHIQVSDNPDFTDITYSDQLPSLAFERDFEAGRAYFWRVRALDNKHNSSEFTPRQQFYVAHEDILNYAPFPPVWVHPAVDSEVDTGEVMLKWSCTDVDDEYLSYTLLVGDSHQSILPVASDIEESEFSLNLDQPSVYYWQVEASDEEGHVVKSPIWWFERSR